MTNGAVAVRDPAALAIKPGQTTWDDFQNAALNQLGLKNASNADRAVFLHQCQRTGLDPFAKQIMMIERKEKVDGNWVSKWTIQTGIEGWRTIRDRAEKREGLRGILSRFTYYDDEDNERKVWTRREPPAVVEVTYTVVERGGREVPYTSQLRYSEYVQTKEINGQRVPIAQWAAKPVHMTEKCTEADVYRKTFPQDYAGIELSDAMPPPDPDAPPVHVQSEWVRVTAEQARARQRPQTVASTATAIPDPPPASHGSAPNPPAPAGDAGEGPTRDELLAAINGRLEKLGVVPDERRGMVARIVGQAISSTKDLTDPDVRKVADTLEGMDDALALDGLLAEIALANDPREETTDAE
jgi:phage recombination protein Bet